MPDYAQKVPFARSINRFAEQKALAAMQLAGRALPCSIVSVDGSIVTVQFEVDATPFTIPNVTMPVAFPEYIRVPFQPGDKGVTIPATAYLGGITGLGGGIATLVMPANLSALVFMPVGNKNWFETPDADALFLYGKAGVTIWDSPDNNCSIVATADALTLTFGDNSIVLSADGIALNGDVTSTGMFENNSVNIGSTHVHGGVQSGGSNTAVPH